jgi:phage I-like protein
MNKQQRRLALALAACSFALPVPGADNLIWLQVTPAGSFGPSDGRPMPVPAWRIDAAIAAKVIERFHVRRTPPVVDYEHQTLHKEENGQPAPAAGWMRDLKWREGEGLFAQVELTARASQYIADGEYLYFSPVFLYDAQTGDVLDLQMGALTNSPAIDGMEALSLRAAATFGLTLETPEDTSVNPLLKAVLAALGLTETTTEEQAIAALSAHQANRAAQRKLLGLDDQATDEALMAACTGLKAKATTTEPDPAKYVPVDVMKDLQSQVAVLSAQLNGDKAERLIQTALEDGRLLKPMEGWARDLAKKDIAALNAYLDAAKPIAALSKTQTEGVPPVVDEKTGLTAEQLAVCSALDIKPADFLATLKA